MSPWVKLTQEETASASSARRVADGVFLILVPVVVVLAVALGQTFDAWHTFVWGFLFIFWIFRLMAFLKRGAR